MNKTSVSIVVSVYNEEKVLDEFWKELKIVINGQDEYDWQVIFVNDGSKDNSQNIINSFVKEEQSHCVVKSVEFSRNFGHEAAMIAGIDSSDDDVIVCLDSDLQHPPKEILNMLALYKQDVDIVLMKRTKRHDNGIIKNFLSALFYKFILKISSTNFETNASDFFMISRQVSDILKSDFRERNRFLRGFIQSLGFNQDVIEYESPARFDGESSYSFFSLLKLSMTAVFAFSSKPLALSYFFASLFLAVSTLISAYTLFVYFFGNTPPDGYTTIIMFQSFGFTILCILISILSLYFSRGLDEIRSRPIYLVKRIRTSSKKES